MTTSWMNLNLLPPQPVTKRFSFSIRAVGIGLLCICTITFAILGASAQGSNQNSATLAKDLSVQKVSLSTEIQVLQAQVNALQTQQTLVKQYGQSIDIADTFQGVLRVVPSGTIVQSLALANGVLIVVGQSLAYPDIAQYEEALTKLSSITGVWVNTVGAANKGYSFTLKMMPKGGSIQ